MSLNKAYTRKRVTIFAVLTLLVFALAYSVMKVLPDNNVSQVVKKSVEVEEAESKSDVIVYDTFDSGFQVMLQDDARWAGTEYLGGTIGAKGCGLVCATIAYNHFAEDDVSPADIAAVVGDTCSSDGVNDMGKFGNWLSSMISGVTCSDQIWIAYQMRDIMKQGGDKVAFCGVSGQLGAREYGGHVVMLADANDETVTMYDPACVENNRTWTWLEIEQAPWIYFYIVEKS